MTNRLTLKFHFSEARNDIDYSPCSRQPDTLRRSLQNWLNFRFGICGHPSAAPCECASGVGVGHKLVSRPTAFFDSIDGAGLCGAANIPAALPRPGAPLHLRIRLSEGEPVEDDNDLFGRTVQLASRVCTHAKPDQILGD